MKITTEKVIKRQDPEGRTHECANIFNENVVK